MKFLLAVLLLLLVPLGVPAKSPDTEAAKIQELIASVEHLRGAVFIRNGSEYDNRKAAEHLRLKWKNAGKRVRTAEDFIRLCASQSYLSGQKYRIRFADGHSELSGDYLHQQLQRIESTAKPKPVIAGSGQ